MNNILSEYYPSTYVMQIITHKSIDVFKYMKLYYLRA